MEDRYTPILSEKERAARRAQREKARQRKRRARRRRQLLVLAPVLVLAVALVGYFITCNVRLTEMNKAIADGQAQLSILQSEKVRLETELIGKTSAGQIDRYALENGMLPAEGSQIYYIAAQEDDLVQLPDRGANWVVRLWKQLCSLLS